MSSLSRNRGRSVNPLPEGSVTDHKSQSILKRWRSKGGVSTNRRRNNVSTVAWTLPGSSSGSSRTFGACSCSGIRLLHGGRRQGSSLASVMSTEESHFAKSSSGNGAKSDVNSSTGTPNVVAWMEQCCPRDVLPKILAFAGPQTTAAISKTNKHWSSLVKQESTWRVMCEELYKWKDGDEEPESWFDLYRLSPCVPVDYSNVHSALSVASDPCISSRRNIIATNQIRGVRILLQPGIHYLSHAIDVKAVAGSKISFQTLRPPTNVFRPNPPCLGGHFGQPCLHQNSINSRKKGSKAFRTLMRCVRPEVEDESEVETLTENLSDISGSELAGSATLALEVPKHATLVLRSRRHNEPVFRVQQGLLHLRDIEIQHNSYGTDIWNGNAAVQIQPPLGEDDVPILSGPRPAAVMDRVQISSRSGRGVVNIDGGSVIVRDSMVRDCAATGIYIGGPGSQASILRTDVFRNGVGNRARRGVARGHSGIYLEQGFTKIVDSNISNNTLTGVSVVSSENAVLILEESELISNGTFQLELPPLGSVSRQACITRNNKLSETGQPRLRSGLSAPDPEPISPTAS